MTTTIHTILEEFRQAAKSKRDLGDRFERLIANYLVTDPLYKDKYSDIWLWMEWPDRGKQPDTGIDLVAKERYTGEYCAIQCKFFDPGYTLQKGDIDSFFTTSGKAPFSSRIIVSTTDKWSVHAEEALQNQRIPITRLRVQDLEDSPVDWSQFSLTRPQDIKLKAKRKLLPHQATALVKVLDSFKATDRGKLIMACGTGKTFTSLKIAEQLALSNNQTKYILFLVPSISLISQALREWTAEAEISFRNFVVCSDIKVGKKSESEDISTHDLAYPATTDARSLTQQVKILGGRTQMTVIFSTYQSIKVISDAQALGLPDFELIICDEAHRTTGVTLAGEDESYFVRVHDNDFIKAKKRLYMTATPRIYSDSTKMQAQEHDAILCSMDDENLYGKELHRLGFSESVSNNLLSDYKVMVLAVDEKYVSKAFQKQIADENNEINLEDAVKITGCWNGLSKRMAKYVEGHNFEADATPMHKAVAFSRSIKDSKRFTELFSQIVDEYIRTHRDEEDLLICEVDHVDGTFNALKRNERLDWLKADITAQGNICRILSNARCLAEGVDVPALDAVLFLNPRNSVVDVVQSVGRVMRKVEGKKYGYIILPIGIPADVPPEEALKDNKKYKVVWQVLQALRAHDDRFNTTINQIELNKNRPEQIQVIGVGGDNGDGQGAQGDSSTKLLQLAFNLPFIEEWRNAIYAQIVWKCGDRRYWESWAKDVAQIAERHITRIKALLKDADPQHRAAFDEFLKGLQSNLNPSVDEVDAIEMLAQHLITKPVFDALFEGYQFTQQNPVSIAMQKMLDLLERQAIEKETTSLERFYESVRDRARGIDNAAGKQSVIKELYEKFFKIAFPRMAERLGIVYTPIELVDFIINSVEYALHQEFGVGLSDRDVHILDPFTGTGTFIVRLLQSGFIKPEDLSRKYQNEIHANEILLLAYYIAAINIEETYHHLAGSAYRPFEGIILTDTFQMFENIGTMNETMFPENNQRVARQKQYRIRVIMANPPYSARQESENYANKNLKYPHLDEKIRNTYALQSKAGLKSYLYDSYIRSLRWASDRIEDQGIVCYVTNGSFIDSNAMDGLRKCLTDEFTAIYCFNLRGNARTSGEQRRMEKGNVFGAGTRAPIAVTLLIKNLGEKGKCQLFYHDIGDYLSREEKLRIIKGFGSIKSITWQHIIPNASHDWINQRDPAFDKFIPMGEKKATAENRSIFNLYSLGIVTNRDAWTYNYSRSHLSSNMNRMIDFYNTQVEDFKLMRNRKEPSNSLERQNKVEAFVDNDPQKISWTRSLKNDLGRFVAHQFIEDDLVTGSYRPFCKQWVYFNRNFNEMVYQMPRIFPTSHLRNYVISVPGIGTSKDFSTLILDNLPDLNMQSAGSQCFPLYCYDKVEYKAGQFPSMSDESGYIKKEAINDSALTVFCKTYDPNISKEDIFYYIYGILHSPEYRRRFEANLKKMLPRIPLAQDFWAFSKAGRRLAELHLNYESIEPYPLQEFSGRLELNPKEDYRVRKMTFGRRGKEIDKTTIIYNSNIKLLGIPPEAYDYVVNGKSALEWMMERYQLSIDKDSKIINDPNDWSDDPRYILDLLKRIVRISLETMKIVNSLPPLNERK